MQAFVHTHMRLFGELYVFAAPPAALGLPAVAVEVGLQERGTEHGLRLLVPARAAAAGNALSQLKARVRAEWANPMLACHGARGNRSLEAVNGSWYDRRCHVRCRDWAFKATEYATAVFINSPATSRVELGMAAPEDGATATTRFFTQHSILRLYYVAVPEHGGGGGSVPVGDGGGGSSVAGGGVQAGLRAAERQPDVHAALGVRRAGARGGGVHTRGVALQQLPLSLSFSLRLSLPFSCHVRLK